jgi:6-phosphogluconate dehydrogenase
VAKKGNNIMELGMVGLGRMGANMSLRLLRGGHQVIGYDPRPEPVQELVNQGGRGASTLAELVQLLAPPRTVWIMVPSGRITDDTILALRDLLAPGDTLIDGGNSNYKESLLHANWLHEKQLNFIDVGTSGGIWGLAEGYSLMVGGNKEVVERHRPIFETLAPAPNKGWGYIGPAASGHFVKMIHNGIEYGLMQAYAEGFEIMKAKKEFDLDLYQIAQIWCCGSVIRSWLLDLAALALAEDQDLTGIAGYVPDSGEGRWTVFEAIDLDVPAPVITASLQQRFRSRQGEDDSFADKLLAALRQQFGGHAVRRSGES